MNNKAYVNTCEPKRRMELTLAQIADQMLQNVSRFTLEAFKTFGENFAGISHDPKGIYWDKPTIVKPHFDCRLLYSDTESLLYKFRSDDFFKELAAKPNILSEFDFSNHTEEHQFFNKTTIKNSSFSNAKMNSTENSSTSLFC